MHSLWEKTKGELREARARIEEYERDEVGGSAQGPARAHELALQQVWPLEVVESHRTPARHQPSWDQVAARNPPTPGPLR